MVNHTPLREIIDKHELTPALLARESGLCTATIYNTMNGTSIPEESTARKIVNGLRQFGVKTHQRKKITYSLFIVWPHEGE